MAGWSDVLVAACVSVPPTIAASAAYIRAKRNAVMAKSTDHAVNHRAPHEPTLVAMVSRLVEEIDHPHHGLRPLSVRVDEAIHRLDQHTAWHREEVEQHLPGPHDPGQ